MITSSHVVDEDRLIRSGSGGTIVGPGVEVILGGTVKSSAIGREFDTMVELYNRSAVVAQE